MEPDLAWMSAQELLRGFAAGDFLPSEAMARIAERIARCEPVLNAFTTLTLEGALEDAARADAAWSAGTATRPLEGVPIAVKDLFDTAGVRTTYGSAMFAGHVPQADAAAVTRVRRAGAILVGKTSTHEFAWGITTHNPHFGPARNPWDTDRIPGGSSGGSAAALAAGMVPLALGTDTGGSIRIPAAFCGVSGHKPTFGAVSTAGAMPLAPSLDHAGALARDPADVALLHRVLAGGRARRGRGGLRGARVGLVHAVPGAAPRPSHGRVLDEAAAALRGLGAHVCDVDVPDPAATLRAFTTIQRVEARAAHAGRGLYPHRIGEYGEDVRGRLRAGEDVTAAEHADALAARRRIAHAWLELLATVDVVVSPVSAVGPPEIGAERVEHLGELRELRDLVMPYTVAQNLIGAPAAVVRIGFDDEGLPVGMQISGAPGADATVLECACELHDATGDVQVVRPPDPAAPAGVGSLTSDHGG